MTTETLTQGLELIIDQETLDLRRRERAEQEARARKAEADLARAVTHMTESPRVALAFNDGKKFYVDGPPVLKVPGETQVESDPKKPLAAAGQYGVFVDMLVKAGNKALDAAEKINRNDRLTTVGKNEALQPVYREAVESIAVSWNVIGEKLKATASREANLFAVPKISVGDTVAAIEDRECRDYFFRQAPDQRGRELERMRKDPSGYRMLVALMRSPVPITMAEMEIIGQVWMDGVRSIRPMEAIRIDYEKELGDWALNAIRMLAAVILDAMRLKQYEAMKLVMTSEAEALHEAAAAFGSPAEVVRVKLMLENQKHLAGG